MAVADILDHAGDDVGVERHRIGLADAADAAIGGQLDEHPVEPAIVRRRIGDDEGLGLGDLHGGPRESKEGGRRDSSARARGRKAPLPHRACEEIGVLVSGISCITVRRASSLDKLGMRKLSMRIVFSWPPPTKQT